MCKKRSRWGLLVLSAVLTLASGAYADETVYELTLKEHRFSPPELKIPANKRVKIVVFNQDAAAEEFESFDLNREKVVSGNGKILLFIGPLKPGVYKYFGEFNPKTAQGIVIAE